MIYPRWKRYILDKQRQILDKPNKETSYKWSQRAQAAQSKNELKNKHEAYQSWLIEDNKFLLPATKLPDFVDIFSSHIFFSQQLCILRA